MCNWWSEQLLCYKQRTIILLHRPAIIHHSSLPLPPFKNLSRHFQVFQSCMPCTVSSLSLLFALLHLLFFPPFLFLPLFMQFYCLYCTDVVHWIVAIMFDPNFRTIWLLFGWCESDIKETDMDIPNHTGLCTAMMSHSCQKIVKWVYIRVNHHSSLLIFPLYLGVNYHIDFPTQHRHVHIRNCTAGS